MEITTEWLRAAVEGTTVDGRTLSRVVLEQMAKNYSQSVYNARVWQEHIRGLTADSIFKSLGDVVAAKVETVTGGILGGRLGFYVKIAPHPDLIAYVRNGQKIHLSVEIDTDFSDTGEAYLVGLGVTDSPASLGTEVMKFSVTDRGSHLFSTPIDAEYIGDDKSQNKTIEFC